MTESQIPSTDYALGGASEAVETALRVWQSDGTTRKLWDRRADLFSGEDEARWMGWLDLPSASPEVAIGSAAVRDAIRQHDSDTLVVVGMGGSSLWPTVLGRTFNGPAGVAAGGPDEGRSKNGRARKLVVLDTTVPDALEDAIARLDLPKTLVFIASKSGSTLEPTAIGELLYERMEAKLGQGAAGSHFVAITDPGSALESHAQARGFLGVAHGLPSVGGRFSALSPFGLLPAEAMGLDAEALQRRAARMASACAKSEISEENPGVALGVALGILAKRGRDKLTLTTSPRIDAFGGWIDQLISESTGKNGKGITPIVGETLPDAATAGTDRVFVDLALANEASSGGAAKSRADRLAALEQAGHPVIRIRLASPLDLVQEVFRWEIATAVASALLELNPFDQPDVEAAKVKSRAILEGGPAGTGLGGPILEADGLRLFASPALADALSAETHPKNWMRILFATLADGDVITLNAFLEESDPIRRALEALRAQIARARPQATTLAFGPRYLHSSGQLQKGGPNHFVGLQLWQSAEQRPFPPLAIPVLGGDFDSLVEAQAAGDFAVLGERGRRMIGIDVGPNPKQAIEILMTWIDGALA